MSTPDAAVVASHCIQCRWCKSDWGQNWWSYNHNQYFTFNNVLCVILRLKRWWIKWKSPWVKHTLSEICFGKSVYWKIISHCSDIPRPNKLVKTNSNQHQQTPTEETHWSNKLQQTSLLAFVCAVWIGLKTKPLMSLSVIIILGEFCSLQTPN